MAQVPLAPDLFVIKAISPERQKPETDNYEVRSRLNNGKWAPTPMRLKGILEVRWFLNSVILTLTSGRHPFSRFGETICAGLQEVLIVGWLKG